MAKKRKGQSKPDRPERDAADPQRRLIVAALVIAGASLSLDVVRFILDEQRRPVSPGGNIVVTPPSAHLGLTGQPVLVVASDTFPLHESLTIQKMPAKHHATGSFAPPHS